MFREYIYILVIILYNIPNFKRFLKVWYSKKYSIMKGIVRFGSQTDLASSDTCSFTY